MKKLLFIVVLLTIGTVLVGCNPKEQEKLECKINERLIEDKCVEIAPACPENLYYIDGYCETDPDTIVIDIYYLNDFHGAILSDDDEIGIANIANFIKSKRYVNPNTVVIAGGDMLQGSAMSNYYSGLSTIEFMNIIEFDAFTLGNHEFDWGIDTVTNYFDGDESNGEANFPLLSSNVFLKNTETPIEHIEPYTIVTLGDIKIGIIGYLGYGLERSIATSKIEDYEIKSPLDYIAEYTEYLRTVENVDIVIVSGHDGGGANAAIESLSGDQSVDVMFNAHTHTESIDTRDVPELQAGANGEFVGHVQIKITNGVITYGTIENYSLYDSALFDVEDEQAGNLLESYLFETDPIFNAPIITSGDSLSKTELSNWITELMRISTESDIAFHNYGGTRTSIDNGQMINLSVLYDVWPFDNAVKTVYLSGSQIKQLMQDNSLASSTNITEFINDQEYKVATNDYVFDKTNYPFINGDNPVLTEILIRDLAEIELYLQAEIHTNFSTSNTILFTSEIIN